MPNYVSGTQTEKRALRRELSSYEDGQRHCILQPLLRFAGVQFWNSVSRRAGVPAIRHAVDVPIDVDVPSKE
jgi:hypothetical protein